MCEDRDDVHTEDDKEQKSMQEQIEDIFATNIAYYRLWFFKIITKSTSEFIKLTIILSLGFLSVLFLSITLAIALSYWIESFVWGFLIVGILFLCVLVSVVLLKKNLIDKWVLEKMHRLFSKK